MDNEEFNENNNKKNFADRIEDAANLYNAYQNNKKDVDAINNRAKNEPTNNNINNEEESEDNTSSLEEKEGLDTKEEITEENQNVENKPSTNNNFKNNSKVEGKNKFKSLNLQTKIILILIVIGIVLFLLLLFFVIIALIIDTFTSAISTYFGIPEGDYVQNGVEYDYTGLYTDKNYYYDENGNVLSDEDLVNKLNANNECQGTLWTKFTDFFSTNIKDTCQLARYIESSTAGRNVDKALIIGTIFYGYTAQPNKNDYVDKNDYNDDIPATDHFDTLNDVLKNGKILSKDNLDDLIDQSEINTGGTYYSWEIDSSEEGKLIGRCNKKTLENNEFSILRWELFMRFGSSVSEAYAKAIESNNTSSLYDEECKGSLSNEELLNRVKSSTLNEDTECSLDLSSIEEAKSNYSSGGQNLDIYNQAADVDSKTKDVFQGDFDYRNGFAFTHFPYYASMQSNYTGDKTNLEYDEIFTPKEIETIIQEIVDRKSDLNSVLLFEDTDENDVSYQNNLSSVVKGGYCGNYLKTNLEDITVRLTDCNGLFLANVPFDEYIVGVANSEVSDSNDNYVLSQMVAAISYALRRHNNYTKGTVIDMRSGTCDQSYCSIKLGCISRQDPQGISYLIGGDRKKGTAERQAKYMALYEKASDYLLIQNDKIFSAHYSSDIQNQWYKKATSGMSFAQIIKETYEGEGAELVKCSELDKKDEESISSSGTLATTDYPSVAPKVGKYPGFSYNDEPDGRDITINPEWINENITIINSNCSEAGWNKNYDVNTNAVSNFEKAFSSICNILKNGVTLSNGKTCKYTVNDLGNGGTFVQRTQNSGGFSLHAYGLAQDWNYDRTYTIKGNQYQPYGSNRDIEEYQRFVNAIGGEENCENINYILYKYAYKDAGFNWGGTWTGKTFDGMHFEIKY